VSQRCPETCRIIGKELALLHVGSPIIEARAEERARELLAERRFTAIPGGLESRNHAAR
jgi:hypothetical protein